MVKTKSEKYPATTSSCVIILWNKIWFLLTQVEVGKIWVKRWWQDTKSIPRRCSCTAYRMYVMMGNAKFQPFFWNICTQDSLPFESRDRATNNTFFSQLLIRSSYMIQPQAWLEFIEVTPSWSSSTARRVVQVYNQGQCHTVHYLETIKAFMLYPTECTHGYVNITHNQRGDLHSSA